MALFQWELGRRNLYFNSKLVKRWFLKAVESSFGISRGQNTVDFQWILISNWISARRSAHLDKHWKSERSRNEVGIQFKCISFPILVERHRGFLAVDETCQCKIVRLNLEILWILKNLNRWKTAKGFYFTFHSFNFRFKSLPFSYFVDNYCNDYQKKCRTKTRKNSNLRLRNRLVGYCCSGSGCRFLFCHYCIF